MRIGFVKLNWQVIKASRCFRKPKSQIKAQTQAKVVKEVEEREEAMEVEVATIIHLNNKPVHNINKWKLRKMEM